MRLEGMKVLQRVVNAEKLEVAMKLSEATRTLSVLENNMEVWKEHLGKVDIELRSQLALGLSGDKIHLMMSQRQALLDFLDKLSDEIDVLKKEYDILSGDYKEKNGRDSYMIKMIKATEKDSKMKRERSEELLQNELWQIKTK